MFCKLIVLAACAVAVFAQDKYPAGVSPHLCPNYPHCDNTVLALYSNHNQAGVSHAPQYPAGVNPHACPNYPYCDTKVHGSPAQYAPAFHDLPGFGAHPSFDSFHSLPYGFSGFSAGAHHSPAPHRYPAGVSPHTCPNYPYCH